MCADRRPHASLRDAALTELCDVLERVEATAPTLCEGFDAHEMAIHVWQISYDPLAWPGMVIEKMAHLTARRAVRARRWFSYRELVRRLRNGPKQPRALALDRDALHALGEYWIHAQDVARPNHLTLPAPSSELEDALWERLEHSAKELHGRGPLLRLVRPDGRSIEIGRGGALRVVSGKASELLMWVYGREQWADVVVNQPNG